ncbi:dehydrase and lipid transport-domain-containing protein [Daldinia decipiens]|uniref:dehydrase and lipid transport-domain-containing protein n=1 Tax=Daldinia decipiens TaxID=326647 RepID=UPI0020C51BAC|nr:dehydrase and lipid transport-domain-containing protein [Daldinia decipiens]KAI1663016.1 dehydrase and lipid transport-domain-containing protein [Daldinia decipiens]
MATARLLPRPPRLLSTLQTHPHPPRRTFISIPDPTKPQILTASRRLPYDHERLYDIIADVDSYVRFLPHCKVSRVTRWTDPTPPSSSPSSPGNPHPHPTTRRWPTQADLTAGWGAFQETYTSRLFCVPTLGIVEAISGDARTEIPASELRRHGLADPGPDVGSRGVFKSLVTRWTVVPALRDHQREHGWSDVRLAIKYQFANPLYTAVSSAVADKVAGVMVEAFVQQAQRVLKETRNDPGVVR